MHRWLTILLVPTLAGCLWVSKDEYEQAWDADEDGWGLEEDCHPDNDAIHPYAPDWRGDGCDADCGREADADGDDWPDDADCAPDDPTAYPCSTQSSEHDDVDCDGEPGISRPEGDCDYAKPDPDFPAETQGPITSDCRPSDG